MADEYLVKVASDYKKHFYAARQKEFTLQDNLLYLPTYIMKNNCTGKKKVVHRARLLLWLADYGEPVRCNLVDICVVPPGTVTDRYPPEGCEGDNLMPGCSLQYGLDLTVYLVLIDDLEQMLSRLGCEVHVVVPRNVAGQMIVILDEEETCLECLGSYSEDVPCS